MPYNDPEQQLTAHAEALRGVDQAPEARQHRREPVANHTNLTPEKKGRFAAETHGADGHRLAVACRQGGKMPCPLCGAAACGGPIPPTCCRPPLCHVPACCAQLPPVVVCPAKPAKPVCL
jgi:hypothetical protein